MVTLMPGFSDSVWIEAAKGIADLVGKTGWNVAERSLNKPVKQLIFRASQQYIQNYNDRHGILKVLGMREPVPLEAVYTSAQVLDREFHSFASVEQLEREFRESQTRRLHFPPGSRRTDIEIANSYQHLMILGGPGAGKSTFLRKMGLEALKNKFGNYTHECIPVLLELKRFNSLESELEKAVSQEFSLCNFPSPELVTKKLLKQGKLLILLDGLDEVSTQNIDSIIERIQNFVDLYDKNRYIISCRTSAYRYGFRRFTDVTIAEFDDIQIRQFIHNWFQSGQDLENKTAERCWELLQQPENAAVKELAYTPLLLTLLCLVYDRSQAFPTNRSILYRKALRVLLEEWAAEKRIFQNEIYQGLSTEVEEILLSEIAYKGFEKDQLFFNRFELSDQIKDFLIKNLNASKNLSGESILDTISIQQGILVERARDIYSFSHLTLQEYLTAQYIDDHRLVQQLVTHHLMDKRWHEVFLLVAGLMRGGADELLLEVEQAAQQYTEIPKLAKLLQWSEQITSESSKNIDAVAKRATALLFASNFIPKLKFSRLYARDISHVQSLSPELASTINNLQSFTNAIRAFADKLLTFTYVNPLVGQQSIPSTSNHDFAYDLTHAIEIAQNLIASVKIFEGIDFKGFVKELEFLQAIIPKSNQPQEVHRQFFENLQRVCFEAFKLDISLLEVSQEEARNIEDYLYVNYCLLQCFQAAVRVSPRTWEAIAARLLLPSIGNRDRELLLAQRFLEQVGAAALLTSKRSLQILTIPEDFRLVSPLPVLIVTQKPTNHDIANLFQHHTRLIEERSGDHAGILLYQEPPDTIVREQIADLRLRHRFMIIPVSLAEVEKALPDAHECRGVLRNYVNRYIEQVNFFDDSNAISDKATFFGRIGLLQQLEKGLLRNQGVGLFGLRKSGKTSVLLQLSFLLQDYPVVYIDLQRYSGSRYGAELFNEIIQKLSVLLNDRDFPSTDPLDLFEPGTPAAELTNRFSKQMSKLSSALQGAGYKKPILCFLDEVERILPGSREDQRGMVEEFNACFGVLRALSQEQRSLALLVADVHPDCNQINQWQQKGVPTNPVYSFFKEIFLKPFSEEDTKTMLTDIGGLMKLKFDEKTLEEIHRLSGGHPYVSRQLAGLLCKKIKTEEDGLIGWTNAKCYLERPFSHDRHLMNYIKGSIWEDLEKRDFKAAMQLLKILALKQDKEHWIPEQNLLSILEPEFTENECLDALLWLEDVGLIVRNESTDGNFYQLHLVLLSNWLHMQVTK